MVSQGWLYKKLQHADNIVNNNYLLISSDYHTDFMYERALFLYLYDILVVSLRMTLPKELKYAANILNKRDWLLVKLC